MRQWHSPEMPIDKEEHVFYFSEFSEGPVNSQFQGLPGVTSLKDPITSPFLVTLIQVLGSPNHHITQSYIGVCSYTLFQKVEDPLSPMKPPLCSLV